jgi:hypothetical protein
MIKQQAHADFPQKSRFFLHNAARKKQGTVFYYKFRTDKMVGMKISCRRQKLVGFCLRQKMTNLLSVRQDAFR